MSRWIEKLNEELRKNGRGTLAPASDDDVERAKQFGFPSPLIAFYQDTAPRADDGLIELDQRLWSVANAIAENRDYVPGAALFPLGYVVFASNLFGDAYCVDTVHVSPSGDLPIVLFPHDAIDEGASLEDVEPYRLTIASSLQDFLAKFTSRTLVDEPNYG